MVAFILNIANAHFHKEIKLIIISKIIIISMDNALENQKAGAISLSTDDKMIMFVV